MSSRGSSSSSSATLCAMVTCCFQAPTSPRSRNGASSADDALYMTAEQQARRPQLPWFLGGGHGAEHSTSSSTLGASSSTGVSSRYGYGQDVAFHDRTAISAPNQPPPRWLKDDAIAVCRSCHSEFDLFSRKHHCRGCGLVFCASCTSQRERVLKFGFPEPVRVCGGCANEARIENPFYEAALPLLERGAVFTKHGMLRKRLVEFNFIRARHLFQYRTVDADTGAPDSDVKALPLDAITDVRAVEEGSGEQNVVGLVIALGSDEHRLDASSELLRDQWLRAIQQARALRSALVEKERVRRASQVAQENDEMRKMTASLQSMEQRKASFHQDRLRKRAEQRDSLRVKYNLAPSSSSGSTTAVAS